MYWLKDLYLGESVRDREKEIRHKLYTNAGQINIHILAVSESPQEQIDIIPAFVFQQKRSLWNDLHVFGIAGKKSEALELVRQIAEETYRSTGGADMRSYLSAKAYQRSRR